MDTVDNWQTLLILIITNDDEAMNFSFSYFKNCNILFLYF